MAIPQINLDDRTFDQLATEARSLIPRYCPAWTDYNPSDPGVTLLELFAYLAEASIYHINRVPERSLERFAALAGIVPNPGEPIAGTLNRALEALDSDRHPTRTVTENDIEHLVTRTAGLNIARCRAVVAPFPDPGSNGGADTRQTYFPADSIVKIIIVPADPAADVGALCEKTFEFLAPRTLVATKIAVIPPDYTPVRLSITVVRASNSRLDANALGTEISTSVSKFRRSHRRNRWQWLAVWKGSLSRRSVPADRGARRGRPCRAAADARRCQPRGRRDRRGDFAGVAAFAGSVDRTDGVNHLMREARNSNAIEQKGTHRSPGSYNVTRGSACS